MKKDNCSYWVIGINCSDTSIVYSDISFSNRFAKDKLYYSDEQYDIIVDGIIINKKLLLEEHRFSKFEELFIEASKNHDFVKQFFGPFTFVVIDKKKKECFSAANQTGDTSVFYFYQKRTDVIYLSNNFNELLPFIEERTLNEESAHYLLTFGTIINSGTIVKEINRVHAGRALFIKEGKCSIGRYHKFDFSNKIKISFEEAIEQIDIRFKESVELCIEKDKEYGYNKMFTELSAGLDSRMVNWIAKSCFKASINALSFSQSNSDEQKYALLVARHLGIPIYYRPLDDLGFIKDIDNIVKEEFGLAFYCGVSCCKEVFNFINWDDLGLLHTGQIGDIVISAFLPRDYNQIDINYKRYSNVIPLRYFPDISEYKTQEEYLFYTRAVGALSTHYLTANYTYAVSPFLNPDFIQYCISLPDSYRSKHKLYWAWVDRRYPEAGKIPCSRTRKYSGIGFKHATQSFFRVFSRKMTVFMWKAAHKLRLVKSSVSANNMNPYAYWYETNYEFREFVDTYYYNNISFATKFPRIKEDLSVMYESGDVFGKLMTISLLSTLKAYLTDDRK